MKVIGRAMIAPGPSKIDAVFVDGERIDFVDRGDGTADMVTVHGGCTRDRLAAAAAGEEFRGMSER